MGGFLVRIRIVKRFQLLHPLLHLSEISFNQLGSLILILGLCQVKHRIWGTAADADCIGILGISSCILNVQSSAFLIIEIRYFRNRNLIDAGFKCYFIFIIQCRSLAVILCGNQL